MTCSKALTLCLVLIAPAVASAEGPDLHTWGKLAPIKKTEFFQLTYKARGEKGKVKSKKAFLHFAEGAAFFVDRWVPLASLEANTSVWIYGKPAERSIVLDDGRTQVDRQIVNTLAIATGADFGLVSNPKSKGPAEQIWLQATISQAGNNVHVQYEGNEYKIVCLKGYGVVVRQKLPEAPKLKKKKKLLVEVVAGSSDVLPEKAKPGDVAFAVRRMVILDRRLQKNVYPLLLPR